MESIKLTIEIPPHQAQLFVDQIAGLVAMSANKQISEAAEKDHTLTEKDVKKKLDVSSSTLKRWRDKGLPHDKVGRKIIYTNSGLREFLTKYGKKLP